MKTKNLIRFMQSLVVLPVVAMTIPMGDLHNIEIPRSALVLQMNTETQGLTVLNQTPSLEVELLQAKAEAIDAYFRKYDMPLYGTGEKMAEEAEKNGLDWRLIAAIAVRESTGGKHDCEKVSHNPFGWAS